MTRFTIQELEEQLGMAHQALLASESRRASGQAAIEVMHEIRGPLDAMGHLLLLAKEAAGQPTLVRDYLTFAEEQLTTAVFIANRTLSMARTSVLPRSADLVTILEAALRIHQRKITEKSISLVKQIPDSLIAEVHTVDILQVLSNLIVNAVEALPEKGRLSVRLKQRGDQVHMVIADNGQGIAHQHHDQIFDDFFTTKNGTGTGLGLSLSKRIVNQHRGVIKMRTSVAAGRSGTSFRIALPRRYIRS